MRGDLPLNIQFQNDFFIIIEKPAGMLSVPSRQGPSDPRPIAGKILEEHLNQQIFPVHRLDECVSGLLVFALSPKSHREANKWFESHKIEKTYEALSINCEDRFAKNNFDWEKWESNLCRGKKRAYEASFGKPSVTLAKFMGHNPALRSIWHLKPLTGRSHQLRYEMSKRELPIDGDRLYGSGVDLPDSNEISLKAFRLNFENCDNYKSFGLPDELILKPNQR